MAKFIKKPVAIEAIQWNGMNTKQILEFMGQNVDLSHPIASEKFDEYCRHAVEVGITITTLEDGDDCRAKHVASLNDYIIRGIQGEFYPCKPEIFEQTYWTDKEYADICVEL